MTTRSRLETSGRLAMALLFGLMTCARPALAGAGAPVTRDLRAGEVRRYWVELQTAGVFRGPIGGGRTEKLALAISGTLEVEVARVEGAAAVARVRLLEVGMRGTTGSHTLEPAALAQSKATLEAGVLVRLDADGLMPFVDGGAAMDPQGAEILRYLASALQVQLPPAGAKTWSANETDATGAYAALYTVQDQPGDDALHFSKKKTGYDAASAGVTTDLGLFSASADGHYEGAVGADGWIRELSGEERDQAFLGHAKPNSVVDTTVSVRASGTRPLNAKDARELAAVAMPSQSSGRARHRFSSERLAASAAMTLGDLDVAGILRRAAQLEQRPDEGEPELEIFEKVRAFVVVHPDRLREIEAALSGKGQSSLFYRAAMLALGQLGTPETQALVRRQVLAKVTAGDWESNALLMPLLAQPEEPDQASEALLKSLRSGSTLPEVETSAHLSLGIMANQLRAVAPRRANAIVEEYARTLQAAPSPSERSLLIDALGNSASTRLPDILQDELASPDAGRRAEAVQALRLVRTAKSLAIVVAAASAAENQVRRAAVQALALHNGMLGPYLGQLLPLLKSEPVAEVRMGLLRALSDDVRRSVPVQAAIAAVAQEDGEPAIRAFAASILKTAGHALLLQ